MIHIKARGLLKDFLLLVEYESFIFGINPEHPKRDGKILYSDAEEPTELDYKIIDFASHYVDHDVLDLTHLLVYLVMDLVTDDR